jgi:hypothetical protein
MIGMTMGGTLYFANVLGKRRGKRDFTQFAEMLPFYKCKKFIPSVRK